MTEQKRGAAAPSLADLPTGLVPVYEDKAGNIFYQFTSDAEMTYKRFFAAQIQEKFIRFGMTPEFMQKAIDAGKAIVWDKSRSEQQVRQDCATVFANFEMRLGYVCGEDQWLNMAAVFFVLAEEPRDSFSDDWAKRKKALWEADPDAKSFFLQKAFSISQAYVNTSPDDIPYYLAIAQERESNIPTLPRT